MEIVRQDGNGKRHIVYCCDRCGKINGGGVHTCNPNPVITTLKDDNNKLRARLAEAERQRDELLAALQQLKARELKRKEREQND